LLLGRCSARIATSNVGGYAITQGSLAATANYALTYVGANLAVTAAPLASTQSFQSLRSRGSGSICHERTSPNKACSSPYAD
jgi:hypothetical protein